MAFIKIDIIQRRSSRNDGTMERSIYVAALTLHNYCSFPDADDKDEKFLSGRKDSIAPEMSR